MVHLHVFHILYDIFLNNLDLFDHSLKNLKFKNLYLQKFMDIKTQHQTNWE
jgi:hypothetical protein